MIKLKEGLHQNQIVLQAPAGIMDQGHRTFHTQTQSLGEKLNIELYQIMSEEAFNPEVKNKFSAMRLVQ